MATKLTEEEYLKQVEVIHKGKIKVLGKFKGSTTKVLVKCNICGHEWEVTPYNTLKGIGCRKCVDRSRARTYDDFIREFREIHGDNIEILTEYQGMSSRLKLRCTIDGHIWETTANCLIGKKHTGCDECYRRRTRRTHEEYIREMKEIHGDSIEVLGKYYNNATKVPLKCNICGHEWTSVYRNSVTLGYGCKNCGYKRRMKFHEKYINDIKNKFGDKIEILGKYINNRTPILTKCHEHDITWEAKPTDLLKSHGCRQCTTKAIRRSHEEYVEIMNELHPDIEVLGKYEGSLVKVDLSCKVCNHKWSTMPNSSIGKKRGCPKCAIRSLDRTHEEYVALMKEIHPTIEVLGEYVNTTVKVELKCKVCNHTWSAAPANSITGSKTGCPACKESHLEKETRRILIDYGYEFESQFYFDDLVGYFNVPLKFDFITMQDENVVLIECQGVQHREPTDFRGEGREKAEERFQRQLKYDDMKRRYCEEKGYKLIEVWYDEDILTSLQTQGICKEKPLS